MKKIILKIKEKIPNIEICHDFNLKNILSYHVDCIAKTLIKVSNEKDLILLLFLFHENQTQYFILGGGSNVLFKKRKTSEIIVHLCYGEIERLDDNKLKVFAGAKFFNLLNYCKLNGLSGLEWASHIPASVGGAVYMNMGAFSHCVAEYLDEVVYFKNGKIETKKISKEDFSYRSSFFKDNDCIVINATFKLKTSTNEDVAKIMREYTRKKAELQPIYDFSCGSVFKNGENYFVAELIEKLNLKGYSIGGAEVSTLHSNFIINKENATSKDILRIIKHIKKVVQKHYNICIFCEVVIR